MCVYVCVRSIDRSIKRSEGKFVGEGGSGLEGDELKLIAAPAALGFGPANEASSL